MLMSVEKDILNLIDYDDVINIVAQHSQLPKQKYCINIVVFWGFSIYLIYGLGRYTEIWAGNIFSTPKF